MTTGRSINEKEFHWPVHLLHKPMHNSAHKLEQAARLTSQATHTYNKPRGWSSASNMKLNLKLPKANSWRESCMRKVFNSLVTLAMVVSIQRASGHYQFQEPTPSNEINHQQHPTNYTHLTRDVTNLRMVPDFRSIRLRWDYVQPNMSQVEPAMFEIRYCELTSWMAEIKCRHRNLPVAAAPDDEPVGATANNTTVTGRGPPQLARANNTNSTVIPQEEQQQRSDAVVRRLASEPSEKGPKSAVGMISNAFETHIYDLRALTNYTFEVHVSRFTSEPSASSHSDSKSGSSSSSSSTTRSQPRPARRLDLMGDPNELLSSSVAAKRDGRLFLAETKPFQAEALKCLANSSEVLVNTGRYFGGRISVESQPYDSRCQLVGNKTSSQTSYLFRIDHEICRSKLIDSDRIETMILVHENKDILTHNTARFLVQCNIMQKSFTVKASVSLPKINSINQQSARSSITGRPATITVLDGRPAQSTGNSRAQNDVQQERLGSMLGVYRLIRTGGGPDQAEMDRTTMMPNGDFHRPMSEASHGALPRAASRDADGDGGQAVTTSARRSKELMSHDTTRPRDNRIAGDNYQLELPKQVEVSSKVLFVDGSNTDRVTYFPSVPKNRQRGARLGPAPASQSKSLIPPLSSILGGTLSGSVQVESRNVSSRLLAGQHHKLPVEQLQFAERSGSSSALADEINGDNLALSSIAQPIIMTNNHRVANEFASLDQVANSNYHGPARAMAGAKETIDPVDYSIKYSPAKVSEYSLEQLTPTNSHESTMRQPPSRESKTLVPVQARSRSGRMRHIVSTSPKLSLVASADRVEGRMGDAMPQQQTDLIGAESSLMPQKVITAAAEQPRDSPTNATAGSHIVTATTTGINSVGPTLAQNITGALIRWSLKTLGNLARKFLVGERDLVLAGNNQTGSLDFVVGGGPSVQLDERIRDGFLVDGSLDKGATIRNQPFFTSTTTSAVGLQQPVRAATQSADLVQSRAPHHLEPPPLLNQTGAYNSGEATTAALAVTAPPQATSASTRTTRSPVAQQQPQRQQKSSKHNHKHHPGQQHSTQIKSQHSDGNITPQPSASESQTEESNLIGSSSSSFWPIYMPWGLIGSVVMFVIVIYLIAFSSSPQTFKPSSMSRHYNDETSQSQQPRFGFLSQLNDVIYRHRHSLTPDRPEAAPSEAGLCIPSKGLQQQHQFNTITRLLPLSDVHSPSESFA